MHNWTFRLAEDTALHERVPASPARTRCLEAQHGARERSTVARAIGLSPLAPAARDWYRAALGERVVTAALDQLGPAWTVLHAVPVGAADTDIDHILVGPPGIFTIDTTSPVGRRAWVGGRSLRIDDESTDHLRTAVYDAARAAKLLAQASGGIVHVQPVVVLAGVDSLVRGGKGSPVEVLLADELLAWLQSQPRRLSPETVDFFAGLAERRSTWHVTGAAATEELSTDADEEAEFERLDAEVREAEDRASLARRLAGVVALLAGVGILFELITAVSGVVGNLD